MHKKRSKTEPVSGRIAGSGRDAVSLGGSPAWSAVFLGGQTGGAWRVAGGCGMAARLCGE